MTTDTLEDGYDYEPDEEDGEEWRPGQCDNCSGYVPPAGTFAPACACAIGQGADEEDCTCGPDDRG